MVVEEQLMFADSSDSSMDDFQLREGLSWKAKKEAEFLYSIARGVMLVTGQPGSGKDLFGISLAAMNKYYFNRRILLDFLPRRAFGEYTLFNAQVMMEEINRMAKAAGVEKFEKGKDKKERDEIAEYLGKQWVEEEGEILLKGGFLYLSELRRYCYNRNPHNPFNKFIGSICSVWRHLDLLVLGTYINRHEIDQYSFLSHVTHWAKCSWSLVRPHTTDVRISRGAFIGANNVYNVEGKDIILHVDGSAPRRFLGIKKDENGNDIMEKDKSGNLVPVYNSFFDLYVTKSMVNLKPVVRRSV